MYLVLLLTQCKIVGLSESQVTTILKLPAPI